jgi:hypothetical protein
MYKLKIPKEFMTRLRRGFDVTGAASVIGLSTWQSQFIVVIVLVTIGDRNSNLLLCITIFSPHDKIGVLT